MTTTRTTNHFPSRENTNDEQTARYVVGIDLGTTNSAVCYVDVPEKKWRIRTFAIPQLVAAGLVESRETLPSFHYESHAGESVAGHPSLSYIVGTYARDHGGKTTGRLVASAKSWLCHSGVDRTSKLLPWQAADDVTKLSPVDVTARYLSHIRAAWDHAFPQYPLAEQDVVITLPASFDEVARELTIRAARAAGIPRIVLLEEPQAAFYAWIYETEARDEGQGASHSCSLTPHHSPLAPSSKILVCDIGGGTTDLTLIRVRAQEGGSVRFHRVAVGDHLILGGDNLDLALAHHLETRLVGQGKLATNLWGVLVRIACDVKEKLLGRSTGLLADDAPEKITVSLPSVGSKLIGGAKQIEVTREEVEQLLVDGFMPLVPLDAKPSRHQSGVREFGLPYATDHAITRYLAQFLTTHRHAGSSDDERENDSPIPDIVLLNGGMFEAAKMRQRLMNQLTAWNGEWKTVVGNANNSRKRREGTACPNGVTGEHTQTGHSVCLRQTPFPATVSCLLENTRLDLAVARGAAYYGMVRRGYGERISAGLARTYYLGVECGDEVTTHNSPPATRHSSLLCLLPAGTEVDHEVTLDDRSFDLLIGKPIQFPVFVSSVRLTDQTGELLPFDPLEMTALPPIQTVIKTRNNQNKKVAGNVNSSRERREGTACPNGVTGEHAQTGHSVCFRQTAFPAAVSKKTTVTVQLTGKLTEIGTLELWCVECKGKGRWRLDFDVRSVTQTDRDAVVGTAERDGIVDEETWLPVQEALAATFDETGVDKPNRLMRRLDETSNMRRDDWPTSLLRRIGDELIEHFFDGRRKTPEHEARWLNLVGYAYRPGYGLSLDDWRIEQLWRKVQSNLISKTMDCRLQNWILWRRVAGGLSAGQQKTLADPLLGNVRNLHRQATTGLGRGADMDLYSQEGAEIWRLLGSLERLPVETKVELGDMILDLFRRKKAAPVYAAMIWTLGRLGSRELMYGSLNTVIPPQIAEQWLRKIIGEDGREVRGEGRWAEQLAVMQLARKTGDRYRDIGQPTRELALAVLENREHLATLVRKVSQLDTDEQIAVFGETLPLGLRLRHEK